MVLLCAGQSWAGWAGKNNGLTQGQARPCISDLCWSSWWWLGVCSVESTKTLQGYSQDRAGQSRTGRRDWWSPGRQEPTEQLVISVSLSARRVSSEDCQPPLSVHWLTAHQHQEVDGFLILYKDPVSVSVGQSELQTQSSSGVRCEV